MIPESAPIGVFMSGGQSQVILVVEDDTMYESYVYYYNKHEGPRMFILETLEIERKDLYHKEKSKWSDGTNTNVRVVAQYHSPGKT